MRDPARPGLLKRVLINREWIWECVDGCPDPEAPTTDGLAALEEIRARNEWRIKYHLYTEYTVAHDVPEGDVWRLLAALDRLVKLADKWEADAGELDRDAAGARTSPYAGDHAQALTDEALAGTLRECAQATRETITRGLAGEENTDD